MLKLCNVKQKKLLWLVLFVCGCLFFQADCFSASAQDSTYINAPTVVPSDNNGVSGVDPCTYYAQDTYLGTELPGPVTITLYSPYTRASVGIPNPPLVTKQGILNLAWSGGATSPLNTPVFCSGVYVYYFTLQIESTDTNATTDVHVCVVTADGFFVFGLCPANAYNSFRFSHVPMCNGGDFCGKQTYTFTGSTYLTAGQTVLPPSVYSNDAAIAVTGGEFILYYVKSGALPGYTPFRP